MLLALETATNVCSVAFKDASGQVHEKRTDERGSHSEKLFLFIEELIKSRSFSISELEGVLVSEGPGSYTGLRIAASAVKGLLFESEVPLFGINTLASFAQTAADQTADSRKRIHGIIDARRVHVYHQQFSYKRGNLIAESTVKVIPIKDFEGMVEDGDFIVGTGQHRIEESVLVQGRILNQETITARSLIRLFEEDNEQDFIRQVQVDEFEPVYYTSRQVTG